jgi:hypothetical protein
MDCTSVNSNQYIGDLYPDTFFQLCLCERDMPKWIEQMKIQYVEGRMTPWQLCVKDFCLWKSDRMKQSKSNIYQSVLRDYLLSIGFTCKSRHIRIQNRYNHYPLYSVQKKFRPAKVVQPQKAKLLGPPLIDSRLTRISPGIFQLSINTSNNAIDHVHSLHQ